ncbi:hypothetical protein FQA47_001220 [Oryzias melastigma]|uniref:Uncharacterized protein n=1 Tax=Oryzias melastigma TaxID=30732 RepID=A0A834L0N2_ORYME|nr:hypothetical protein FQA47_001220 [Oryzias melastigma]
MTMIGTRGRRGSSEQQNWVKRRRLQCDPVSRRTETNDQLLCQITNTQTYKHEGVALKQEHRFTCQLEAQRFISYVFSTEVWMQLICLPSRTQQEPPRSFRTPQSSAELQVYS